MRLWRHQQAALDWLSGRSHALLDMEMGVGKTFVVIEAVRRLRGGILVLCPKAVVPVWTHQLAKHADYDYEVCELFKGSTSKRAAQIQIRDDRPSFVIVNYDAAWRGALRDKLSSLTWECIIADESQRIKSPGGKASRFASFLRARSKRRLCLTGTPMPHSPLDIYAQARFLNPQHFGTSFVRFKSRFAIVEDKSFGGRRVPVIKGFRRLDELRSIMARFTFRLTTADTDLELPEFQHITMPVEMDPGQARTYRQMELQMVTWVESEHREGRPVTANGVLDKVIKLQQITGGHLREDPEAPWRMVGEAKEVCLREILEDLPPGEPVVVFNRFHPDMDAAHRAAAAAGRKSLELSGRRNELPAWQAAEQEPTVLVVQIQAGGVGVDLTRARYAIYYSIGYSLGDYEQSLKRVHRPGQERHVYYYHLTCRGTIDERIYRAMREKKKPIDEILTSLNREKRECRV